MPLSSYQLRLVILTSAISVAIEMCPGVFNFPSGRCYLKGQEHLRLGSTGVELRILRARQSAHRVWTKHAWRG